MSVVVGECQFADSRLLQGCVYCGAKANTRDHVPSKVLLDDPLPDDLAVVSCCADCNNGFSSDEQYLACFIECVINGSTLPERLEREKIKRTLAARPFIAAAIDGCRSEEPGGRLLWKPDYDLVERVVLKLARGHVAYDCSESCQDEPSELRIVPLCCMSPADARLSIMCGRKSGAEHFSALLGLERTIMDGR